MRRKILGLAAISMVLLGACGGSNSPAQAVIGRWQIVQDTTLYEPYLFSHDIELRSGGEWIVLVIDQDRSYTIQADHYTLKAGDRIEVTGWCWKGYDRFECSGEFNFGVDAKTLNIFDDAGHSAVYKRVGDIGSSVPPTLVPPFATPVP